MPPNKKLNLSRFKKGMQGLIDFAVLLEQADPAHRDTLILLAGEQDSEFLFQVMRKAVFFEELVFLDDSVLAEILANVSPKILAYALVGMEEPFRKKMFDNIGFRSMKLVQDEQERLDAESGQAFAIGARKQILKIARALEIQQRFVFELTDCPRFKMKRAKAR